MTIKITQADTQRGIPTEARCPAGHLWTKQPGDTYAATLSIWGREHLGCLAPVSSTRPVLPTIGPPCADCSHRSQDHGDGLMQSPSCFKCPCPVYARGSEPSGKDGDAFSIWVPADPSEQVIYVGILDADTPEDEKATASACLTVDDALGFARELTHAAIAKRDQLA